MSEFTADQTVRAHPYPISSGHSRVHQIRPMTFDTNPDGSTKNIYVQLSGYHGVAVVDFVSGKEPGGSSTRRFRTNIRTPTACRVRRRTAPASHPTASSGPPARSTATRMSTHFPT